MFLDYWMMGLFIVVAGVWAEYRYRCGVRDAKKAGDNTLAFMIVQNKVFPGPLVATLVYQKLLDTGLIKFEYGQQTNVIGADDSRVPAGELSFEVIRDEFCKKLVSELGRSGKER